ncbi:hypothetical protein ABZY09_07935 [Streptomyces sp. NPDC002928]|uniref:hypothetical protein n=1 Tax=Streptomyces sp. NPDC002928 TaxID=3154440 RepID=UPI0033B0A1EA
MPERRVSEHKVASIPAEAQSTGAHPDWCDDTARRLQPHRKRAPRHVRWINQLGLLVSVGSDDEALLANLADFYRPYYALLPGPPPRTPDLTLTLLVNGPPAAGAACTDMRVYRSRPELHGHGSGLALYRRDRPDLVIAVDEARRDVLVLGSRTVEVGLQARVLLRDQLLQRIEHRAGFRIFHAAAAVRDDRGVAVLGDRNAGKTTTLLALLGAGYDFVTADRLSVGPDGQGVVMAGVPARANVHAVAFGSGQPLDGLVEGADWPAAVEGKVLVDVPALTGHFGVGAVPRARPGTLLLPQIDATAGSMQADVVRDPHQARELLSHNLLTDDSPGNTHRPWLRLPLPEAPRRTGAPTALLDRLVAQCRVMTVRGCYADYLDWLARVPGDLL